MYKEGYQIPRILNHKPEVVVQNTLALLMFGDRISEKREIMTTWSGQDRTMLQQMVLKVG